LNANWKFGENAATRQEKYLIGAGFEPAITILA